MANIWVTVVGMDSLLSKLCRVNNTHLIRHNVSFDIPAIEYAKPVLWADRPHTYTA